MTDQTLSDEAISLCTGQLAALDVAWVPASMMPFLFGEVSVGNEPAPDDSDTSQADPSDDALAELMSVPLAKLKARAKTPSYRALLRNPDSFTGDPVYLKGEILQAQDDEDGGQFMLVGHQGTLRHLGRPRRRSLVRTPTRHP
ncbi:MAG TPA: hypothetical protein VJZ50_11805 [Candidatus Limnocylindrales bacterium]|nr:hypothetical protein [Candidatus Limnocylindrales bacterium]